MALRIPKGKPTDTEKNFPHGCMAMHMIPALQETIRAEAEQILERAADGGPGIYCPTLQDHFFPWKTGGSTGTVRGRKEWKPSRVKSRSETNPARK